MENSSGQIDRIIIRQNHRSNIGCLGVDLIAKMTLSITISHIDGWIPCCCVAVQEQAVGLALTHRILIMMDRQLKQQRLEPLSAKNHQERPTSFTTNDPLKLKFRSNAHPERYRTEPSFDNLNEDLPRKMSRKKNQFSEEYMSLVNRLKVNLSKDHFDKKERVQVYREKEHLYPDQNQGKLTKLIAKSIRQKSKETFQYYPRESLDNPTQRSATTIRKETDRHNRTSRDEDVFPETHQFRSSYESQKKTRLPPMTTQDKHRYGQTNELAEIEQKNENEKIGKVKANKTTRKLSTLRQERKKMISKPNQACKHMADDSNQAEQLKEINSKYAKLEELCFHIEILMDIYQAFNSQEITGETSAILLKMIKDYVLGNKKATGDRIISDDISHLEQIYTQEGNRKLLRSMVFSQRILMIISIDLLATSRLHLHLHEINQVLLSLMGMYLYFLYACKRISGHLTEDCEKWLIAFQRKVHQHNIHLKKQLISSTFFIHKKLFPVLKSNPTLLEQIKVLINQFENRNVTINRSFYELLKLYAIYLNNNEALLDKNYAALRTFATCPSPYLTKPSPKRYSLVLDLDETLVFAANSKLKLQIYLRPFVKQFLQLMSRDYQIIIFTSSMPQYAEEIIAQLPFVSRQLYRHHTTRIKNKHVKDLSRLGRALEKTLIVDNQEENYILQKANGIHISEWRGDNPLDQELNILGLFLTEMAASAPEDVRDYLPKLRQFRKNYY